MKSFQDYIGLRELAAYDVGKGLLGRASLSDDSQGALAAALEAVELLLATPSGNQIIAVLNRLAPMNKELQGVLAKHGLDSFKDGGFRSDLKRAAKKGQRAIMGGLADVNPNDMEGDLLAKPYADTNSGSMG